MVARATKEATALACSFVQNHVAGSVIPTVLPNRYRTQEIAGSSPASSIAQPPSSRLPDDHTGTAAAEFHNERDILLRRSHQGLRSRQMGEGRPTGGLSSGPLLAS